MATLNGNERWNFSKAPLQHNTSLGISDISKGPTFVYECAQNVAAGAVSYVPADVYFGKVLHYKVNGWGGGVFPFWVCSHFLLL